MPDPQWPSTPPRKILLATDLTARCDRALDRAAQLANQWNAALIVAHALETPSDTARSAAYEDLPSWRRPPDPAFAVKHQIRRDLRDAVPNLDIVVTEGETADVVLDVVKKEQCDLIVIATAADQGLGRIKLGHAVEFLIRRAPIPVLVVKSRPAGPYGHVLIGTDFTNEARHGLSVAAKLFPKATFAVMHAFDIPYRSLLSRSELASSFTAMEQDEIRDFVRNADIDEDVRSHIVTLIEHGPPEIMMHNYVAERHADLTVIGTVGRGMLFHLLIGGQAPKIVDGVPSDILVVRFPTGK